LLISFATFRAVDEKRKGGVSIIGVVSELALPTTLYLIAVLAIYLIACAPFFAASVAIAIYARDIVLATRIVTYSVIVISAAFGFFLQFSPYELIIERKGPLECIWNSFAIVRRSFLETIVFFFITTSIEWLVELPFLIVLYLIFGLALVAMIAVSAALSSAVGLAAAAVVGGAVFLVWAVLYKATHNSIVLPLTYRYWRRIRK
jgi:hypothetical protein